MRHGLSGQNIMLTAEELPHYAQMGLEYIRELKPVGVREIGNAQLIFESRWRLHRILSVENDLFCIARPTPQYDAGDSNTPGKTHTRRPGFDRQVNAFREEAHNIEIISRYETRIIRNGGRLTAEFDTLQQRRAKHSPDLVFDEQTSPAVAWYLKLQARCAALAEARQAYEANQEAITTADSAASNENSVGKIVSDARSDAPSPPQKTVSAEQGTPNEDEQTGDLHPKTWLFAA